MIKQLDGECEEHGCQVASYQNSIADLERRNKKLREFVGMMIIAFPSNDTRSEWCRRIYNGEDPEDVLLGEKPDDKTA